MLLSDTERAALAQRLNLPQSTINDIVGEVERKQPGTNPTDGQRLRAKEVQKLISRKRVDAYREAYENGRSFSMWLEELDPSDRYNDGLDAFERQLYLNNIRTRSIPEKGVYADTVQKMCDGGAGVPKLEDVTNERFYMSDQPASIVLFPEFINRQLRVTGQILPSILQDLVAITTGINSNVYDSFYLNLDTTQLSLRRITEAADMPTAELTGSQHSIRLKKYGRRLIGSYEVYRRMSIDRFAFHLQQMAIQAAVDKSQTALDVIINGDGNTGTAATNYNLSTLQAGGAGAPLSVNGWLSFNLKFKDPYKITTIIGQDSAILQLLLLNMGTFNLPFAQFQNLQNGLGGAFNVAEPVNMGTGIRLYSRAFAPANTLIAIDNTRALEMVTEMGADIVETDKMISKQMNEIVVSEVVGFASLDSLANKSLTLNL